MSNNTSPRRMEEGHIILSFKVVRPKPCEAEMVLQMSTYNGEKKAWNWEKYVA